jgi:L-malate glycosyltransferase
VKIGISCYPVYGGSGVVATELGIELARRGHEVHFITYAQPFRLPYFVERIFYHEVEVPSYPLFEHPPYNLALSVAIQNVVEQHNLDIVHAHYAVPHATSAWIAKEMLGRPGFRVVTTLHGTDITLVGQDPSYRSITEFSIRKSDGLTAVSESLRWQTHNAFGSDIDIKVIPNFVDLAKYGRNVHPCHRSKLARDGEKIITHISNFRPVKRVDDVVRIFGQIAESVPARLLLVGDGPDRVRVQETADSLGISDRVLFLGKVA